MKNDRILNTFVLLALWHIVELWMRYQLNAKWEEYKAMRLLNTETEKIIISRDVKLLQSDNNMRITDLSNDKTNYSKVNVIITNKFI